MTQKAPHNDQPISDPSEDRFGIDPFAKTLATSIRKLTAPEGTVIALNGTWGSGKSSAINLIVHHLKEAIEADEIAVINFACWWFRGEEALALAFFRELYAGLGPTLGERFTRALPKLGARLLRAGSMVGAGIDLAGGAGVGSVASGAMNWISSLIQQDDTIEKLHSELSKALSEQQKRFLIVIDDIDRLAPDEALLIFRLVKSVGRLPNVVYLLAFDRLLAEAIVAEKYPSEGPHYLEKIIQGGFDLPEPRQDDLRNQLLQQLSEICGAPQEVDVVRFMNIFYDVVAPEIRTPRDVVRLTNSLLVTWSAVGAEVDRADFIALETLRLMRPSLYRALRANKDKVCGISQSGMNRSEREQSAEYDGEFLSAHPEQDRARLRRALMRLFPRLQSIWSNVHHSDSGEWVRQRRVSAEVHFDSYFRFSLSGENLPRDEINQLLTRAADQNFITTSFRNALAVTRPSGATKAALLLDELNLHASEVSDEAIQPLLTALFAMADELNIAADRAKAFDIGDNNLRIHWLLRRLTLERFDLAQRSAIFMAACKSAALGWLIDFSDSAYGDYYPREGKEPESERNCLTTSADADKLRKMSLSRIRKASKSDELADHAALPYLLYRWRDLAADEGAEVKNWTKRQLRKNDLIVKFAKAFTSYSWSHSIGFSGLGDAVAKRNTRASVGSIETILDKDVFRSRVEELAEGEILHDSETEVVSVFLAAWKRHDKNPRE